MHVCTTSSSLLSCLRHGFTNPDFFQFLRYFMGVTFRNLELVKDCREQLICLVVMGK